MATFISCCQTDDSVLKSHQCPWKSMKMYAKNPVEHSVRQSLLVSVNALIFYLLLPPFTIHNTHTFQHKEGTNVLFELSASVGEWCIPSTADYIILLVHLCLTGRTLPPAMKRKVLYNPIWFTCRRQAAVTSKWQLFLVKHAADWHQLRKK